MRAAPLHPLEPDLPRDVPADLSRIKAEIIADVASDPILVQAIYDGARRLAAQEPKTPTPPAARRAKSLDLRVKPSFAALARHINGVVTSALSADIVIPILDERLEQRLRATADSKARRHSIASVGSATRGQTAPLSEATEDEKPSRRRRWAKGQTRAWSTMKKRSTETKKQSTPPPPPPREGSSAGTDFSPLNGNWVHPASAQLESKQPSNGQASPHGVNHARAINASDPREATEEAYRKMAASADMDRPSEAKTVAAMEQFAKEFGSLRVAHRRRGRRTGSPEGSDDDAGDGKSRVIYHPRADEESVEGEDMSGGKQGRTMETPPRRPSGAGSITAAQSVRDATPESSEKDESETSPVVGKEIWDDAPIPNPPKEQPSNGAQPSTKPTPAYVSAMAVAEPSEAVMMDSAQVETVDCLVAEATEAIMDSDFDFGSSDEEHADEFTLYNRIRDTFGDRFPEVEFGEEIIFSQKFRSSHPEVRDEVTALVAQHEGDQVALLSVLGRFRVSDDRALPRAVCKRVAAFLTPRRARFPVDPVWAVEEIPKATLEELPDLFYSEEEIARFESEAAEEGWL